MARLRVLIVSQGYPPAVGGTEGVVAHIAEELVRLGDEVTVFTTDRRSSQSFPRPNSPRLVSGWEERSGIRIRRFPVVSWPGPALFWAQRIAYRFNLPGNDRIRTWFQGPIVAGLESAIRAAQADVILASSFPLLHMFTALRAGLAEGRPVVFIGGLHPDDAWGFDRPMIGEAIAQCNAYVAYTEYEAREAERRGATPGRVWTIGVGVDPERFLNVDKEAARREIGLGGNGEPVVGFVGQLAAHKGLGLLTEAMTRVWRSRPDTRLLIAGATTQYSTELEQRIEKLDVERRNRVMLLRDFPEESKPRIFAAMDIVVYPSSLESFGTTFLEAWAAGKPVIGCRCGAVPWVIDEGRDGLLVSPSDCDELAEALELLLGDRERSVRLAEAGRRKVLEHYRWPQIVGQLREVLTEVTSCPDAE